MFYLGVYLEQEEGTAQVVVVEKDLSSGAKRYRISHVEALHEETRDGLTKALLAMHLDDRWTAVKKVFSQNGRPPKIKREPPLILLSSWDNGLHMAEEMRGRCVSVEVIVSAEPDEAFRSRLKADNFHNCHVVTPDMMLSSFGKALKKESLKADKLTVDPSSPLHPLARVLLVENGGLPSLNGSFPWFSALGSCIWHGESIRRIKRY